MDDGASLLALQPAVLRRVRQGGNLPSHYLDFIVDGQSLTEQIASVPGLVTPTNRAWLPTVRDAVDTLRGARPADGLPAGRIALYVGVSVDVGCSTLGVPSASMRRALHQGGSSCASSD